MMHWWNGGRGGVCGYDPLADAVEYGRELIPRVRSLVAERDTAHQNNAALPV